LRVLTTTRRNDSGDQFRLMAEAVFETTDQLAPLPNPERKLLRRVTQPKDDKRRIVARYKHGDASVSLARPDRQPLARWTVTLVVCSGGRSRTHWPRQAYLHLLECSHRRRNPWPVIRWAASPKRTGIRGRHFGVTGNRVWLLERHDYRTPAEARDHLLTLARGREMIGLFTSVSGEAGPDEQVSWWKREWEDD